MKAIIAGLAGVHGTVGRVQSALLSPVNLLCGAAVVLALAA